MAVGPGASNTDLTNPNVKTCNRCKVEKTTDDFGNLSTKYSKDGKYPSCKECRAKQKTEWYQSLSPERRKEIGRKSNARVQQKKAKNPAAWRLAQRCRMHGITTEDFLFLLEKQGSVCAICKVRFADIQDNDIHIDHDHSCCPGDSKGSCGKCIRGLLCSLCNRGLGFFKDDLAALQRACAYIEGGVKP